MYINDDVVTGKLRQVAVRFRRTRGQLTRNRRDQALGSLQDHVGRLQERGGIVVARFERAARQFSKKHA